MEKEVRGRKKSTLTALLMQCSLHLSMLFSYFSPSLGSNASAVVPFNDSLSDAKSKSAPILPIVMVSSNTNI
jgi:hypothetical protein